MLRRRKDNEISAAGGENQHAVLHEISSQDCMESAQGDVCYQAAEREMHGCAVMPYTASLGLHTPDGDYMPSLRLGYQEKALAEASAFSW